MMQRSSSRRLPPQDRTNGRAWPRARNSVFRCHTGWQRLALGPEIPDDVVAVPPSGIRHSSLIGGAVAARKMQCARVDEQGVTRLHGPTEKLHGGITAALFEIGTAAAVRRRRVVISGSRGRPVVLMVKVTSGYAFKAIVGRHAGQCHPHTDNLRSA